MAKRKAPPKGKPTEPTTPASETWNRLPWRKLEQAVYRIQKRIYRAKQRDETRTVQKLQKLLMKSKAARLIAVRRVTQDNQGKKTAGVDGVKDVKPQDRLLLAEMIHPKHWKHHRPRPVRRVWIPKPGKSERRPLGIPPMIERAQQTLVKMALEPEWEAVFEKNSYGFRPGRSCWDAIQAIFDHIKFKPKFVLDADLKGAFDHINHQALLTKLHTTPALRQIIKGWLKAGVMEGVEFTPTEAGTPQGGPLSPLLMNVALHGMEEACIRGIKRAWETDRPILIRYADDYVLLHAQLDILQRASNNVESWLANMGLQVNTQKTRITHTLTPINGNVGFDFLGCHFLQVARSPKRSGKNTKGQPLGFKTLIRPSKEKIKNHIRELNKKIRSLRGAPQEALISALNPMIRGWARYYRTVEATRTFCGCDSALYYQLMSWAKWRHTKKSKGWMTKKYWRQVRDRLAFAVSDTNCLTLHSKTTIIRPYRKVKGNASPYNGDLLYWSQRLQHHPLTRTTLGKLLYKQQGRCRWCELAFRDGDHIEIDHLDGNHANHALSNQMALHLHCHDARHAKFHKEWTPAEGINHK